MDLSTLKVDDDAVDLTLKNPVTGEKLDIVLNVIGTDNPKFKMADRAITKKNLKKNSKGGRVNLGGLDLEETEEDAIKLAATCIQGWKNVVIDDKKVNYSSAAAVDLLKEYPWIRDQVEEFVSDRVNFIKAS